MKYVDKIIFRGNETYQKFYQGSNFLFQVTKNPIFKDPFCIISNVDGSTISGGSALYQYSNLEYSYNNEDWEEWNSNKTFTINKGETIYFRGDNPTGIAVKTQDATGGTQRGDGVGFIINGNVSLKGNIKSLIGNYTNNRCRYSFLFNGCTGIYHAKDLILDADNGANNYVYEGLFANCGNMIDAPTLNTIGERIGSYTYAYMFMYCNSLIEVNGTFSQIPMSHSFYNMFQSCKSLIKAPNLTFNTIDGESACQSMFERCTSLITAPELLFSDFGYDRYNSCKYMFQGCTKLNYVKCLATNPSHSDYSTENNLYRWLDEVSATGTFIKKSGVDWPTGISGIPTGWTVRTE